MRDWSMGTLVEPKGLCYVVPRPCGRLLMARRRGHYDVVQLKLRLEEYIRRRLEHSAKKNSRSLNSEIVHRLRQSLRDAEDDTDATAKAVMDSLDPKVLDRIIEMVN